MICGVCDKNEAKNHIDYDTPSFSGQVPICSECYGKYGMFPPNEMEVLKRLYPKAVPTPVDLVGKAMAWIP